jgi:hypothetical protein
MHAASGRAMNQLMRQGPIGAGLPAAADAQAIAGKLACTPGKPSI